LLVRQSGQEGMFGAARPFAFTEDGTKISPIRRSAVGQRVQIAPCRLEIGDAAEPGKFEA